MDIDAYSTFVSAFDKATKEFIANSGSANEHEIGIVNQMIERLVELDPASETVIDPA